MERVGARAAAADVEGVQVVEQGQKVGAEVFEAAVVGTLTVASPTVPYAAAIEHGRTGLLASPHRWRATLDEAVSIIDDSARYVAMAQAARDHVLAIYGWDRQAKDIAQGLTSTVGMRRRGSSTRGARVDCAA